MLSNEVIFPQREKWKKEKGIDSDVLKPDSAI